MSERRIEKSIRRIEKKIASSAPLYMAAAVWPVMALLTPLYRLGPAVLTLALSAAAYRAGVKLFPPTVVSIPAPEKPIRTGEAATDAMLEKVRSDLALLPQLDDFIEDEALSACIRRMERAGAGILHEVSERPEKARQIRRFAEYYLPTSIKILSAYARMEQRPGENAAELRREVEQNAETIAKAFEAQLDSLFESEAMDISIDIEVLKDMLKGDALN